MHLHQTFYSRQLTISLLHYNFFFRMAGYWPLENDRSPNQLSAPRGFYIFYKSPGTPAGPFLPGDVTVAEIFGQVLCHVYKHLQLHNCTYRNKVNT